MGVDGYEVIAILQDIVDPSVTFLRQIIVALWPCGLISPAARGPWWSCGSIDPSQVELDELQVIEGESRPGPHPGLQPLPGLGHNMEPAASKQHVVSHGLGVL